MMPRTEVSLEAETLQLFTSRDGRTTDQQTQPNPWIWCGWCRSHVKPITNAEAAILTRVCAHLIRQQVETGMIHYIETSDGRHLVCPNSL
jgi:hypothetical protein